MDTCGIFNLHGIPGIIAFICGAISITTYDSELTNLPFALNSLDVRREHPNPSLIWGLAYPYAFVLVISTPQSQ